MENTRKPLLSIFSQAEFRHSVALQFFPLNMQSEQVQETGSSKKKKVLLTFSQIAQ